MMPSPELHQTEMILIVDEDLGFVVWLGLTLAASGYRTIPATSCQDARHLIGEAQIATLDLVILNSALPGASDLIGALNSRGFSFQVISIEGNRLHSSQSGSESESKWLSMVRKACGNSSSDPIV